VDKTVYYIPDRNRIVSVDNIHKYKLYSFFDAYWKGTEKVGFEFINTVAVDYGDSSIEDSLYEKLKKVRAMEECDWEEYADRCRKNKSKMYIDCKDYVRIFLFIVTLGDPSIEYTEVDSEVIDIGGYGFFS